MDLKMISSEDAPVAIGPYSQGVGGHSLFFVSGQLGLDPKKGTLKEGITEQTRQSLENCKAILKEAGLSLNRVLKCTVYLDNMDDFKAMNEVYGEYFNSHKPARAAIEVSKLPLGGLVEIEMIAEY